MSVQLRRSFLLFLLGYSVLYMDAILAFILVVTTDCLLVLLLNMPVVAVLYLFVALASKRCHNPSV